MFFTYNKLIFYDDKKSKNIFSFRNKKKYIGNIGTKERDEYEYELRMDIPGKMIKAARIEPNLTQEELDRFIGVQKAPISKIESSVKSATVGILIKVIKA